jgi:hypothetical protein
MKVLDSMVLYEQECVVAGASCFVVVVKEEDCEEEAGRDGIYIGACCSSTHPSQKYLDTHTTHDTRTPCSPLYQIVCVNPDMNLEWGRAIVKTYEGMVSLQLAR